jgi:hypothetical protein
VCVLRGIVGITHLDRGGGEEGKKKTPPKKHSSDVTENVAVRERYAESSTTI